MRGPRLGAEQTAIPSITWPDHFSVAGGPERTTPIQYNQTPAIKWDTESFHTIIRLFAASVPLKCPLSGGKADMTISGAHVCFFGRYWVISGHSNRTITLTLEGVSFEKCHYRTGHRRDQLLIASIYRKRLRLTDGNSFVSDSGHCGAKISADVFRSRAWPKSCC